MLLCETLGGVVFRKSIFSMAYPAVVILFFILLTGCADEKAGGPVGSSLSAPTDPTGRLDSDDSDQAPHSTAADAGGEDPMITMASTPSGITADVTWNQPSGLNSTGYTIYHGKYLYNSPLEETLSEESNPEVAHSEESSWCFQGESRTVETSSTTITGLDPDTPYFFAIRAFTQNESESPCSKAIVVVTPPAEA